MASEVKIHLRRIQGITTEWIHVFTIPSEAIRRFTVYPLKWLRFATFAVCGAKGDLSTEGDEKIVNYNITFDNLANKYFYVPDNDENHFIDLGVFNARSRPSAFTSRHSDFRDELLRRDVCCVVTGFGGEGCHASHIIPRCRGNNYLSFLIRDRSSLYGELSPSLQGDVDINCTENGMLLRSDLHGMFDNAQIGFLKTPNFAMAPADVPRVEDENELGHIPDRRTTLQYIVPPQGRYNIPQCDFLADWSPPSILLDFMYGAAVAKHWKSNHLRAMLEEYFEAAFKLALAKKNSLPAAPPPEDDEPGVDQNDPNDPNWQPSSEEEAGEALISTASADLLKTMDHMLLLPMLLKGIPPQEVAAEWERQKKEAELYSRERSREKVRQWLNSSPGRPVS